MSEGQHFAGSPAQSAERAVRGHFVPSLGGGVGGALSEAFALLYILGTMACALGPSVAVLRHTRSPQLCLLALYPSAILFAALCVLSKVKAEAAVQTALEATVEVTVEVTVKGTVEGGALVIVLVALEATVEVTAEVTVKVTVRVKLKVA